MGDGDGEWCTVPAPAIPDVEAFGSSEIRRGGGGQLQKFRCLLHAKLLGLGLSRVTPLQQSWQIWVVLDYNLTKAAAIEKVHRRSLNLSSSYKIVPQPQNQISGVPQLTKPLQVEAYLTLSHNNLSRSIPAEFAAVNFARIDLLRNQPTGDASPLFGRGKPAQAIDVSRNALEFELTGVELPEQVTTVVRGRESQHDLRRHPDAGGEAEQAASVQRPGRPRRRAATGRASSATPPRAA
uniref:Uncharacterized protein n=1 Tax=Oryza sativa subsp. japonica TaxID=39947 RepID=Q2QQW7_ORYSJ|nr:hypothetical protein LOC_Os12g29610 [Oryza sativa Japonica Group]